MKTILPYFAVCLLLLLVTALTLNRKSGSGLPPVYKADGLIIQDLAVGRGPAAKAGNTVSVNYIGSLTNGAKFDSSYDRGQPLSFQLGAGQVIKGWDEGVVGMKVGGRRKLTIPSALGYGHNGTPDGSIPPNATLVFEVEMLGIG